MTSSPDGLWTRRDLDDGLEAACDAAREVPDEVYRAGWIEGVEFYHRYLVERDRLTSDPE